ncbi:MAG: AFG1 family ATPase [Proteobacteria bacterium]|nr:AFG1 family ATPase [Pseudomonadota bacterium]
MSSNAATPLSLYMEQVAKGYLESHVDQIEVLKYLNEIYKKIHKNYFFKKILYKKITGLYLWGGVGVGKTLILDCFYHASRVGKLRLHFHAFMRKLHQELFLCQGQKNPLKAIAKKLALEYRLICFDEFLVTNVADAMILAEFFRALFDHGVCLVATSNTAPDQLYEHGLQRQRFIPAINLIKEHTKVWHLAIERDYRKRVLEQLPSYYSSLNVASEQAMQHVFAKLSEGQSLAQSALLVNDREITIKQKTSNIVWFDFNIICGRPRSQLDYLAIADQYPIVLISSVPKLDKVSPDKLVSFINLVDIFYDAKIRLIISAEVPIIELYQGKEYQITFKRIESRLIEMQTQKYAHFE